MTPLELSRAYARVAGRHDLPSLTPAGCDIQTRELGDPDSAFSELRRQAPREGWLQFQSQVAAFSAGELPQPAPDWGVLLAAEAVDANGRSTHLRQSGAGNWLLVHCSPKADAPGTNGLVLTDEVRLLATDKAPGPLLYRRYWRLDPETGATPAFAAFIGFGPKEED